MSRRHADIWSHPGHDPVDPYTYLTLITKRSWPWSWMTDSHSFCLMSIGPPIPEIQLLQNLIVKSHDQGHVCGQRSRPHLTLKIQGQGHGQGQTHCSHLRHRVPNSMPQMLPMWSDIDWQSICLLFTSWLSDHFWLRYSKFHIWPWNSRPRSWPRSKPMVTF